MVRFQGLHSKQWKGIFLLLLITGGEARRIGNEIKNRSALKRANKQKIILSNIYQNAERQPEKVIEDKVMKLEIARGWLQYKDDVVCTVLYRDLEEPGSGRLDLYREEDLSYPLSCHGKLPERPHRTLRFLADDAVMLQRKQRGDQIKITGTKFYWNKDADGRPKLKTMFFSPVNHKLSVHFVGDKEWSSLANVREAATAWMSVLRMVQIVGVECLEKGTCLHQCTYIEESNACSSEFCTLEQVPKRTWRQLWKGREQRPRCKPKVGAAANLAAWETFKAKTHKSAELVQRNGCVSTCRSTWEGVSANLHLANEMSREFHEITGQDKALKMPRDMRNVLEKIHQEAEQLSAETADKLGQGFDRRKNQVVPSFVSTALKQKGCGDLPDGSMQALFRLDAAPEDKLPEAKLVFQRYLQACPWLDDFARFPERIPEAEEEAEKFSAQAPETVYSNDVSQSNSSSQSLMQQSASGELDPVTLGNCLWVVAIIGGALIVAGGFVSVIGGAICTRRAQATANGTAEHRVNECTPLLHPGSHCWNNVKLPGIYMMIGGLTVLVIGLPSVYAAIHWTAIETAITASTVAATTAITGALGVETLAGVGGILGTAASAVPMDKVQPMLDDLKHKFASGGGEEEHQAPAQPEQVAPQETYEQCVKRIKAAKLTTTTTTTTAPMVAGLEKLFMDARLRQALIKPFCDEFIKKNVNRVSEVKSEDWKLMKEWAKLSEFEQRRLLEAAAQLAKVAELDESVGTVVGLEELIVRAGLGKEHEPRGPEVLRLFRTELLHLGVYNIREMSRHDWETLSAWSQLSVFEHRDLEEALVPKPEPEWMSVQPYDQAATDVEGLEQLFKNASIRDKVMAKFRTDMVFHGVLSLQEVQSSDWSTLEAWSSLTWFEQRRLLNEFAKAFPDNVVATTTTPDLFHDSAGRSWRSSGPPVGGTTEGDGQEGEEDHKVEHNTVTNP